MISPPECQDILRYAISYNPEDQEFQLLRESCAYRLGPDMSRDIGGLNVLRSGQVLAPLAAEDHQRVEWHSSSSW